MKSKLPRLALASVLALSPLFVGCKGDTGPAGPAGPGGASGTTTTETELHPTDDGPGINITILSVDGASGLDGTFQVGDPVAITFEVKKDDDTDWDLAEFNRGRALFSGPTFNYQRVLTEQKNVKDVAVYNGDGTWTYTFPSNIPATYVAPINDTASFGPEDGELTGQPLLAGTYTVGLYFTWSYSVDENSFQDVDNATQDVLLLGATTLASREVVGDMNCNACHDSLRAHGGQRQDVTVCLLCHTAGSEDKNVVGVAGGTPGVSIDFKVMIHKIHNGAHLPSVNGIATNVDGSRDYAATPVPYEVVGYKNYIHDYSAIEFPRWPSIDYPMPADLGTSLLTGAEQDLEEIQRHGVTDCAACHGDPDGAGPITAPAQGMQAYQQPSRAACGSCHDDVHWDLPYNANGQTMPLDMDDGTCLDCHAASGPPLVPPMLSNLEAHLHPMRDPVHNPGMTFAISAVDEAGTHDGSGTLDPGEKVAVTFTVQHDDGSDVDPVNLVGLGGVAAVLSGPTSNLNLVLNATIPSAALTGAQPYTVNLPEARYLERLATGTASLDIFEVDFKPLWDDRGIPSSLMVRDAIGGLTVLSAAVAPGQNYLDVVDASAYLKDDIIVVEDGLASEEYLQVQFVEGNRLWLGSAYQTDYKPAALQAHPVNGTVHIVTTTDLVLDTDYSVDPTGSYTELIEQGDGAILLASYTGDFVVPATYPVTFNASDDVDESWGRWTGLPLVDGTYRLGLWCDYDLTVSLHGEDNEYPNTSLAGMFEVLVGGATTIEPYGLIEEAESCYACHEDIYFHGGHRRGVDSCIQCHGAAGAEDRPQYRAPNADPTTGTMVKFREMIHKLHMGHELTNADTYVVNGFGLPFLYPNNFTPHMYDHVVFPTFPGSAKHCQKCHGASDAWQVPADLTHPTDATMLSRSWRAACGSCHDGDAVHAHIDAQTAPSGAESCAICHDDGSEYDTEFVHNPRM